MAYIKGIFIQEIYSNPSNGYMVGLLRVKETDIPEYLNKVVTFTGIFDSLKYKSTYKLNGNFQAHNKYGMQFNVETYELILPTDEDEIIEFLSSDLFPIGAATAMKIVNKLGRDAINKIINDDLALAGIPRLSESKANRIREILSDYSSTSEVIIELGKMGFSTKDASAILKKYGASSLKIVNENVYDIKDDVDISFSELDKIAKSNGYLPNDERRLLALTINMMNVLTFNNGDTYLYFQEMYNYMVKETDNVDEDTFTYILLKLEKMGKIVRVDKRYYLWELYEAEHYIVKRLVKLNDMPTKSKSNLEHMISELELIMGITYDDSQKAAIMKAINNNLTIITGGPGTGKTTIIRCIVRVLLDLYKIKRDDIALLAPTGRAARKLIDTTGLPAYTIHKYLKWDKESNIFQINEYNPNTEEYIIIDEASMIDTVLMESLLKGTLASAHIIMVGDYYQLPSVSQGQVLKDLIDSDVLNVVRLNQLYRQTEDSYIVTLANEIKDKEISENLLAKYDDYNFISCPDEEIMNLIAEIVNKAINKGYTEKDIQILAPMYKTVNGIDNLNKMLQGLFNPKEPSKNEIASGEVVYRVGDKILQLVNDGDNGVSNGDIGYIEAINSASKTKSKKHEVVINFDGTRVTYTPKDFGNFMHGYAISVHKSQGGEFRMVIMPVVNSFKRMLYNKLVYTAVTRAKETLMILGNIEAFVYGIRNDYIDNRKTTIKELLIQAYNL